MKPIRVALVNDYQVVVEGLLGLLAGDERLDVVEWDCEVDPQLPVDIVLIDAFTAEYRTPSDAQRVVAGEGSGAVVIYSWYADAQQVERALAAGAAGYVSKALGGPELADALVRVAAGEQVVATGDVVEEDLPGRWPGQDAALSQRESEMIALITQGYTNEQIARECSLSINSVKTYIRNAYRKMGVERRSEAILWGMNNGMQPRPARRELPVDQSQS